ncbi:MAG TPA: B12-binding domain-containing radical SAM protein [Candidatus Hydrogenedentes bacterium]|nr:B12-binding domain-containing radical SAM protein [Candidatus Hydrogenedentota bacterium]
MSVLLVNPNLMRPPIAPLGLEQIADALEKAGHAPHICDLTFAKEWSAALQEAITSVRPDAIVLTVRNLDDAYFASQDFILEKTTRIIRQCRELSPAPVILGGVGFSIAPAEVLEYTGAAYGIWGDGEEALPALLECLAAKKSPAKVPGIVFRADTGITIADRPALYTRKEAPSRRFFDNARYFHEGGQAGLETKRGCGQRCIYCVEPHAKGGRVRLREPESVVTEVRGLLDQGVDVYHLCDSEFNLPMDHAHAVCAALERAGLGGQIQWYTYAYPHPFSIELARAMARAGCAGINFGVDHVHPDILRRLGRNYGLAELRQTAQACRDAGLALMFDMLLGSPGETRQTLAQAIDAMREIQPDRVGLSCGVRIYPNTPLANMVRKQGPLEKNPHLHGTTHDNDSLLKPIFFVDAGLEGSLHALVTDLVAGDKRFLHADPAQIEGNYNYNDNSVLSNAIRAGARGAYWDILRRMEE